MPELHNCENCNAAIAMCEVYYVLSAIREKQNAANAIRVMYEGVITIMKCTVL